MTNYEPSAQAPALGKARRIPRADRDRLAAQSGTAGPTPHPQGGGHTGPPRVPLAPPGMPDSWDEPDPFGRLYGLVSRDGTRTAGFYDASEAEERTAGDYDLDLHLVARKVFIRKSDGSPRVLRGTIPGIGVVPLRLLFQFMRFPEAILPPVQWGLMAPEFLGSEDDYLLAPIIARLRKLFFGERGSNHFIMTAKPLAYGWNPSRSYRVIALTERWWEL